MKVDKDTALMLWEYVYGNKTWATDCFGTYIYRDDYGDLKTKRIRPNGTGQSYNYGWSVDHIMPDAQGGKDHLNNYEPMHQSNNSTKSDSLNFKINDVNYQVVKCDISPGYGYGIKSLRTAKRVDWKAAQSKSFR